jgi:pimeloyl-ACP methyl ester carboxylesterase
MGTRRVGAAIILILLAAVAARADVISMADIARGIVMTQAQCAAIPQAVWISALGRNLCMRYYYSTAGGEGSRPVVFLQGDLGFDADPKTGAWVAPPSLKDTNTDDLIKYADQISKTQKTAGIYLARMGRDGSSGWHRQRHTALEVQATNAALDAIKQRYRFDGFNVYGHSGGGLLVGALLALRKDIGCAVPADGILAVSPKPRSPDPALQYFEVSAHIAAIVQNRGARILVVTDPQDKVVTIQNQNPFVERLRSAGGQVDQFFVNATDDEHHFTTPHAEVVMADCLRGASHDEIADDLTKFDARLLAVKAMAVANAALPDAPIPSIGSMANDVDLFGADYANFRLASAEPKLCQDTCRTDAKCVAWTYVQPGAQGPQARCWLKSRVPRATRDECCISGVERVENNIGKKD